MRWVILAGVIGTLAATAVPAASGRAAMFVAPPSAWPSDLPARRLL